MCEIQAKVSYRIPLVGGFTDYHRFYREHGGQSICCAMNKFLVVSLWRNRHGGLDIHSQADLPWGIGLGSSGAYHAALVLALARFRKQRLSKLAIAQRAYELEVGIDAMATGRQDSLACLFRGVSKIRYGRDDSVTVSGIPLSPRYKTKLANRLMLFDTGERRRARDSIRDILSRRNKPLLHEIAKLPQRLIRAWQTGDMDFTATALDLQERYRRRLSPTCRSPRTDRLLQIARECGAGARLAGAGRGCLICYCLESRQEQLREYIGIPEIRFSILW